MEANPLPDDCKCYFGHSVQVITAYDDPTRTWRAIVYPSECTLASVSCYEIHLHASASMYLEGAVNGLLQTIHRRIAECFRFGNEGEVPGVKECEAKCNCLPRAASPTIAEQGSEVPGVNTALGSVEGISACEGDQPIASDSLEITTGSYGPSHQTSAGQDSSPVLQKIASTVEDIGQPTQHSPVETPTAGDDKKVDRRARQPSAPVESPERVIMPIGDPVLTAQPVESTGLLEALQLDTEPTGPNCFLGRYASAAPHRAEDMTPRTVGATSPSASGEFGTPRQIPDEKDEHTRDIVRKEIGRVLAGAMDSLVGPVRKGGNGET